MDIIIAGAGALGRVIYDFVSKELNVVACVDDSPPENCLFEDKIPIKRIEHIGQYDLSKIRFLLTVLNPRDRESVVKRVLEQNGQFLTYVEETSFISPSALVGSGCTLLPYSFVMNKARVGNYVHIHFNSTVGHDVVVKEYCSLAPQCIIGGYAEIGKNVTIGMGAKVLPKIKIGDFAAIGAGAVVTKDVPPGETVAGNPARILE